MHLQSLRKEKEEADNIAVQEFIATGIGQHDLKQYNSWYSTNMLKYL